MNHGIMHVKRSLNSLTAYANSWQTFYFYATGMAPTEGKKPLKCENNQIICLLRNVKAHGKEVAQEYPVSFAFSLVLSWFI
jgi:hypothetical protein